MSQVSSIFSQLMKLIPRAEFEQAVKQHGADKHAKGFSCWTQFVAMLFLPIGAGQKPAGNRGRTG